MTTLHMDVDVARATKSSLDSTRENILQQISTSRGQVEGLKSDWMGNSANQFFSIYEQWQNQMNSLLDQLQQLNSSLDREISEWEAAAAHF